MEIFKSIKQAYSKKVMWAHGYKFTQDYYKAVIQQFPVITEKKEQHGFKHLTRNTMIKCYCLNETSGVGICQDYSDLYGFRESFDQISRIYGTKK